jgi:hypothetical protein
MTRDRGRGFLTDRWAVQEFACGAEAARRAYEQAGMVVIVA